MSYDPTSKDEAVALCRRLGIDPKKFWGEINDFACDCYQQGQLDAHKDDTEQTEPVELAKTSPYARVNPCPKTDWLKGVKW